MGPCMLCHNTQWFKEAAFYAASLPNKQKSLCYCPVKTNAIAGVSHHILAVVQNTYVFLYMVHREGCEVPHDGRSTAI